jgi:hypothetical protein
VPESVTPAKASAARSSPMKRAASSCSCARSRACPLVSATGASGSASPTKASAWRWSRPCERVNSETPTSSRTLTVSPTTKPRGMGSNQASGPAAGSISSACPRSMVGHSTAENQTKNPAASPAITP